MRSLKQTLSVYILLGLAAVLLLSGLAVFLVAQAGIRAQFDESLMGRARTFAALVVEEPGENGSPGPVILDYTGPLSEADLGLLLRITADDGTAVAQSPDWPSMAPAELQGNSGAALGNIETPGHRFRTASVEVVAARELDEPYADGTPRRSAVVDVMGRMDAVRRAESSVASALLLGGFLAAAGTAAAVWLGVRRGLSPLRRLQRELVQVDPQQPQMPSVAASYPKELRPVTQVLRDLLDRLGEAMARERRFTDAAAHELRTPIAELRTIASVASRWPEPDRLRRAADEAAAIAEEMQSLLEALLAAARGGAVYATHAREMVPLLPMARSIAAREQDRTGSRALSWTIAGDESAGWIGPRAAVQAVVRNVINNAAEYTPGGGCVTATVERDGDRTRLTVQNGPVALDPADVSRMFEPFWRADASRTDRAHRGIGLYVVDCLCRSLGVERAAEILPNGQLMIQLVM